MIYPLLQCHLLMIDHCNVCFVLFFRKISPTYYDGNITLLLLPEVAPTCNIPVRLVDSYGDGWGGYALEVTMKDNIQLLQPGYLKSKYVNFSVPIEDSISFRIRSDSKETPVQPWEIYWAVNDDDTLIGGFETRVSLRCVASAMELKVGYFVTPMVVVQDAYRLRTPSTTW